jgi:hypothetical protein
MALEKVASDLPREKWTTPINFDYVIKAFFHNLVTVTLATLEDFLAQFLVHLAIVFNKCIHSCQIWRDTGCLMSIGHDCFSISILPFLIFSMHLCQKFSKSRPLFYGRNPSIFLKGTDTIHESVAKGSPEDKLNPL